MTREIPPDVKALAESVFETHDGGDTVGYMVAAIMADREERGVMIDRIQAVRKVRDGYADQARFADIDCAVHFREFVRRIDAALAIGMVTA